LEDSNFWLICSALKTIFSLKFPYTTYASWNCTSFNNMIAAPPSSMHYSLLLDNEGKCILGCCILPLEGNPLNLLKFIFHYWRSTSYIFKLLDPISYVLLFNASCSRIFLNNQESIKLKINFTQNSLVSFLQYWSL
jgi:hypothetical protein